jgi:hypothetical protein
MTATSTEQILAYWLIPGESTRSHFSAIISDLAARFDAPIFEPHVTIYVTNAANEDSGSVLERAIKDFGEYRLSIRGLDYSEKFTKTIFVQFELDPDLACLSTELRRASALQSEYELNPHLSLIYKAMDRETKRDVAASIRLPFTKVLFDSVRAVISPATIESREDVDSWRVVTSRRLAQ